jgi:6-phosphogluconate dehydrogenase (decarboxylating)
MELGMIGLGRLGANRANGWCGGGHRVIGFDPKQEARTLIEAVRRSRNQEGMRRRT